MARGRDLRFTDSSTLQNSVRQSATIGPNQTLHSRLTQDDGLNSKRLNRFADDYRLTGLQAGQQVHVRLNSSVFDPYMQLLNAQTGRVLRQDDDGDPNGINSRFTFTAKAGISYTLRVTSYHKQTTGRYTLRTQTTRPAALENFNFNYGYGFVDAAAAVARAIGKRAFPKGQNSAAAAWWLDQMNVPGVWKQRITGNQIVVAVLDSGVNYRHADLKKNIWRNPAEIPGNGIDDDGNGFIDDVRGWNFVGRDSNNPMDRDGHGTHVAGLIAGVKNNIGVTGVAYGAQIMPVRVLDGADDAKISRFDANVAAGIRYAVKNGAHVINMSLGNYPGEASLSQTRSALRLARKAGVAVVMASGNERQSYGTISPIEPALYARRNLGIAVGAVDRQRTVADFSNPAGNRLSPFVVAPGVNIRSTVLHNSYERFDGTSMAAPQVAGVIALMLSANPNLTPQQIGQILSETAVRRNLTVV